MRSSSYSKAPFSQDLCGDDEFITGEIFLAPDGQTVSARRRRGGCTPCRMDAGSAELALCLQEAETSPGGLGGGLALSNTD